MSRPCVVHLVRAANGFAPFEAFMASYESHEAGLDHDLVLLLKGFSSETEARPYVERAAGPEAVFVDDAGYDIDAYAEAAARLGRERYCFLNSFSRIRSDAWLGALDSALNEPRVGLVGATASWASIRSKNLFELGLPSPYRHLLGSRRDFQAQIAVIESEAPGAARAGQRDRSSLARRLSNAVPIMRGMIGFDRFPAPHVRTNVFMLRGETLAALRLGRLRDKTEAMRVESGRRSITRRVQALGARTVVADRNGAIYDPPDWPASETFWQGEQRGLLVDDNQTLAYARGDARRRALLAHFAWGDQARAEVA